MNTDQRSKDYSDIMNIYRPGHADFGYDAKYGFRDYRGGGRSSGRETAARVAAGAVARKLLKELGIEISAYTLSIGDVSIDMDNIDKEEIFKNPFAMPDRKASEKAAVLLDDAIKKADSVGGIVQCEVTGLKAGIGSPVFDKLDALLAKAVLSIGATKGIEFGLGFEASKVNGSFNNDEWYMEDGKPVKYTNNSGGVLGGISDGSKIVFRTAFKPTPSIASKQKTITNDGYEKEIVIKGRHDPIVVARAVIVVEAMTAITVADQILTGMSSRMDFVKDFYSHMNK
jgi:chorismate synthase